MQKEFGTKLVPNSFILVLDTYGVVVEWALTVWGTVKGWRGNKRSLCQNALINQLLKPYTIDANGVRSIYNLQRFPKPLELCGGGSKTVWGETVLAQQLEIKTC